MLAFDGSCISNMFAYNIGDEETLDSLQNSA
jgi:hypothetical protein